VWTVRDGKLASRTVFNDSYSIAQLMQERATISEGNASMTGTANNLLRKQGKLWRFVAILGAWLEALDYTTSDYTRDRIDLLERNVAKLTEELRNGLASSPRDSAP